MVRHVHRYRDGRIYTLLKGGKMMVNKTLTKNERRLVTRLVISDCVHPNYYNGSGRWTRKGPDYAARLVTILSARGMVAAMTPQGMATKVTMSGCYPWGSDVNYAAISAKSFTGWWFLNPLPPCRLLCAQGCSSAVYDAAK